MLTSRSENQSGLLRTHPLKCPFFKKKLFKGLILCVTGCSCCRVSWSDFIVCERSEHKSVFNNGYISQLFVKWCIGKDEDLSNSRGATRGCLCL